MLKLAETRSEISVVIGQICVPTHSKNLAEFILNLVKTNQYGIYHGVIKGYCSWYEFAKVIFEKAGIEMKINPISTKEYPTKAARPLNSKLSKRTLIMLELTYCHIGKMQFADLLVSFCDR